ncbi:tyrosine-type recombinase/integrase [Ornithinibacillus massiliensis]|uniref:Tyrosine-type recombinase/integrase n=1 Tax=Ornithinibacillus massiliensis TaxID=1944633 RepID=A0ABS5MDY0_9BACI|nr:tyrosine-type recombinase/integrase [Ornithinibacillus massiliensis]MBS3679953.1 tyrosine-type recombinase/integrase [Ornithinibacillus massiliensis]
MLLEDVLREYEYHCQARNFTKKTMKNKRQELKQVLEFLQTKRGIAELESVTSHDLDAYLRIKRQKGLKPQSIVSMAKQVKAFFNWCVKEEYLTINPMDKVTLPRIPKVLLTGLTSREVVDMMESFSNTKYLEIRNKAILGMMADCGLRAMEIAGLKENDVRDTTIKVFGKGNKERIVFISPALKKILIRYERIKKEYFTNRIKYNDNYFLAYQGKAMSTVAVYNLVIEAAERVGIKGKRVSPHMFRHYFAVQSIMAGIDVYSLSRLLGHSDVSTTQRYLESLDNDQLLEKATSSSPLMNLNRRNR